LKHRKKTNKDIVIGNFRHNRASNPTKEDESKMQALIEEWLKTNKVKQIQGKYAE